MNKYTKKCRISRRLFVQILGFASVFSVNTLTAKTAVKKTAEATEGPFYPKKDMRYDDIDNDLVKIEGKVQDAGGEVVELTGIVTDVESVPLAGLRIEIWQCDVNGHYLHTGDNNSVPMDQGFQGFGHTITNDTGEYRFRTIKPVSYPGRTPHIHVKLFRNGTVLTTQFYIKGHPQNATDSLFRRMSRDQQHSVEMDFVTSSEGSGHAVVNIVC